MECMPVWDVCICIDGERANTVVRIEFSMCSVCATDRITNYAPFSPCY